MVPQVLYELQTSQTWNQGHEAQAGRQIIGTTDDCRVTLNGLPSLQAILSAVVQSSNLSDEVKIALAIATQALFERLSLLCNVLCTKDLGQYGKEGKAGLQLIGTSEDPF